MINSVGIISVAIVESTEEYMYARQISSTATEAPLEPTTEAAAVVQKWRWTSSKLSDCLSITFDRFGNNTWRGPGIAGTVPVMSWRLCPN